MKLTFLGTGTSTGVPQIGCSCEVCRSTDTRDKRLRASVLIQPYPNSPCLIIDGGPDLRTQLLGQDSPAITAALLTHVHYDHIGGLDDLRPYTYNTPGGFPLYCRYDVAQRLKSQIPYAFAEKLYPGAPSFDLRLISEEKPFEINLREQFPNLKVTPLAVSHGKLPILGYRIANLAYITDASFLSDTTINTINGVHTLIINALRHEPHASHFSLAQALEVVERVRPEVTYFIHMSHQIGLHSMVEQTLPANTHLAYDTLTIEIPD